MTRWTVAHQAPLSVEFSRQEYRSGLPFPSPGDLPDPGVEPGCRTLQADSLPTKPPAKTSAPERGLVISRRVQRWHVEESGPELTLPPLPWAERTAVEGHPVTCHGGCSSCMCSGPGWEERISPPVHWEDRRCRSPVSQSGS